MNVYLYIAENNPDEAYEICKKYGYFNVQSIEELAICLQDIVSENGQDSLQQILEIHPEKEVILELFEKKKVEEQPNVEELVTKILQNRRMDRQMERDMEREMRRDRDCSCMKSADATVTAVPQSNIVNQTNTYILVGALIVSIAILSMKK
jgi:hypothetical protein